MKKKKKSLMSGGGIDTYGPPFILTTHNFSVVAKIVLFFVALVFFTNY